MQSPQREEQTRLGRHMLIIGWIIALGLLSLLFSDVLEQQQNPNRDVQMRIGGDGAREVVLQRNHQGHYVASGTLNGHAAVFLLDTGATVVSVPEGLARRIGLKAGAPMQSNTANGMITTYATRIDEVSLGGITLYDVMAHINPHMHGDEVLLGMSFLKKLEMIQKGKTLTLRQAS